MLKFIIIGLVCNSQECYWTNTGNKDIYISYQTCKSAADLLKSRSIMYFKTDCMVKPDA